MRENRLVSRRREITILLDAYKKTQTRIERESAGVGRECGGPTQHSGLDALESASPGSGGGPDPGAELSTRAAGEGPLGADWVMQLDFKSVSRRCG